MTGSRPLGLEARITRRDFLDAVLLGSGAALVAGRSPLELLASDGAAAFDGYGGIGDYAHANGNTWAVLQEGHRLRDPAIASLKLQDVRIADTVDCAIVGGGISGLAAALFLERQSGGRASSLVLDNHPIFGGLARSNEILVGGERLVGNQASALFFPPIRGSFLDEFYRSIGIDRDVFDYQAWAGPSPEMPVGRTCYFGGGTSAAFYFGAAFGQPDGTLVVDPYGRGFEGAPLDDRIRRELLAASHEHEVRAKWLPKAHGDADARRLDGMTLEDHLIEAYGISRDTVRRFLSPIAGGGAGLGADAVSAYVDYAPDVLLPWRYDEGPQMFPGGNSGVARHIVKTLLPDAIDGDRSLEGVCRGRVRPALLDRAGGRVRIRSSATVLGVEHEGTPGAAASVRVVYRQAGRLHAVRARSVIVAGGSWTARHIVRDLPDSHRRAYAEFHRSPCLVAHVAVRNWRFLYDHGIHECRWFEGIGNFLAVRRLPTFGPGSPTLSPDTPVLLTFKILFSRPGEPLQDQVEHGRAELLATPFAEYERRAAGAAGRDVRPVRFRCPP